MKQKIEFIHRHENLSIYRVGPHTVSAQNKTELEKTLSERKPSEVFHVSETYSQITPESAEEGDFSDTGWTDHGSFMTLREVRDRILDTVGTYFEGGFEGTSVDLYQSDYHTVCYRTGTEEQACLHITCSERNMKRLKAFMSREEQS